MSTYYNEETGQYENFENAVMEALEKIDQALHSGEENQGGGE